MDPPDGKIPALRPEAQHRATPSDADLFAVNERQLTGGSSGGGPFNGPEDFSLYDRCITRGLPGSMLPHVQGNSYQIVQAPGWVAIRYELLHDTRVIPLDPRPHVRPGIQLEMGDARGHWKGDALVIETRNFKEARTATRQRPHCALSSVSRARHPTGLSGPSRSTTRGRGRSAGRSSCH